LSRNGKINVVYNDISIAYLVEMHATELS